MPYEPGVARPASTILLLRDGAADAIDVFMMVRHYQIEFASGALVFPGGSVDAGDHAIAERPDLWTGGQGLDPEALAFRIAAIRETFEESRILLARRQGAAELIAATEAGAIADRHRDTLNAGTIGFADIIADHGLTLALDLLVPYAHWITPEGMKKRFDTWFFLAAAPQDQIGLHDGKEATDSIWLSPREALDGGASGRFTLPFPTTRNLIKLGQQPGVAAALDDARRSTVVTVMPVVTQDGGKRQLRIPLAAGYDGDVFEMSGVP